MTLRYIMRHYGTCGHVVDTESKKVFDEYAGWRQTTDLVTGKIVDYQNEVSTEGDAQVVHVHPFRYCPCMNCVEADLGAEERHYEKLSESLPKVQAKDEQVWLEVKRVLRERKFESFWISNKDRWVAFKELSAYAAECFVAVGATAHGVTLCKHGHAFHRMGCPCLETNLINAGARCEQECSKEPIKR